ncbi:hypothetical protein KC322_g3 [Hortaea werneckii]|nr:hypothetical protein KC322_g3 [Hortaea werneckii]
MRVTILNTSSGRLATVWKARLKEMFRIVSADHLFGEMSETTCGATRRRNPVASLDTGPRRACSEAFDKKSLYIGITTVVLMSSDAPNQLDKLNQEAFH